MDADAESARDEETATDSSESRESLRERIPLRLRTVAFVFLIVGFVGAIADETAPIGLDSVYSYVFFAGVACAIASVYLGIMQNEAVDD